MRVSSSTIILFFMSTSVAFTFGHQKNSQDDCGSQETCMACIRSQNCVWCNIVVDERDKKPLQRCVNQEYAKLAPQNQWCKSGKQVNYKTEGKLIRNDQLSSSNNGKAIQIQPQIINLKLRQGEEYRLKVKYRQAEDYPVDLYFLVDLSNSMRGFRNDLANLGGQIVEAMKRLTSNFRLGFGSFVDKNIRPFTVDRPIGYNDGFRHYSYKNQMPLTDNYEQLQPNVIKSILTGNWDEPEGGLDGVMQVIVCTEEIKWRSDARHLLVYVSDQSPHIAGDGRLGGLPEPHDEKCHLNASGYYSHAELQDYPSLGQINWQARKNNINIIFATIWWFQDVYETIQTVIEGSSVGIFDNRSETVIKLIDEQYKKLVKLIKMTSNSTSDSLDVKFFSKCLNKEGKLESTNKCDGVRVNQDIEFEVGIKALRCPKDKNDWHKIIEIKPEGINENVIVNIELICECECSMTKEEKRKLVGAIECNGNGVLECGVCSCDEEYYGNSCLCKAGETAMVNDRSKDDYCRFDNTSKICNDKGKCICGSCSCGRMENSEESYYGKYCQCNDFSCIYWSDGKLCGKHGHCECGKCVCDSGWGGPDCSCRDAISMCRPPGNNAQICSGAGKCECGECICDVKTGRNGPFCEDCPSCSSQRCDEFKDCVECRVHKSGKLYAEDPNCLMCPEDVVTLIDAVEDDSDEVKPGDHICHIAGDDGSTFVFKYFYDEDEPNGVPKIFAEKTKHFRVIDDFLAVTIGVVLLTAFLGFLIILIWKICTHVHDNREYEKFVKETNQIKFQAGENPLHVPPTMTYKNPTYDTSLQDTQLATPSDLD